MSIEIIKNDLPNTPDEVIDIWLSTHYQRFGWPPKLDNDWRYILRPGNDLGYLRSLNWQKRTILITPDMLSPKDQEIIFNLYQSHVLKQQTLYSIMMTDGAERFLRCSEYIQEHGVFPCPIVLQETEQGYLILDGNHRLLAFFYRLGILKTDPQVQRCLNVKAEQEVWLATVKP